PASSTGVRERSAETLRLLPTQALRLRWRAIDALTRQQRLPTRVRPECRYAHFPPPRWPTAGARQTREPGAIPAHYDATHPVAEKQSPIHRVQTLFSARTLIREWQLRRGRIAAPLPDTGSVDRDYSSCAFREYEVPQRRDHWGRQHTGCSLASAG